MKAALRRALALACLIPLAACATAMETRPGRTATEQLLVAHAAEKAAQQFVLHTAPGARVFLDTVNFRGEGAEYAASALRHALISRGAILAPDASAADIVVEVRLGALSIDQMNRVLGVPALTLPTSSDWTTATIPELSLYSRRDRTGVAEFSAFAYDPETGRPVPVTPRVAGTTKLRSHKLLMVLSWGPQEVEPGDPPLSELPWWQLW